jgi:large subunit ribosomal protein L13
VVDARGKTLGRVSTEIATLLQGKHKPTYTPHLAAGDFVVVVNASKFRVSGNKLAAKMYYRHSGYHGGLTEQTLEELLEKHPTRALRQAVKGMLPKNIRGKHMLSRLKLYEGEEHPHQAQVNASRAQAAPVEPPAPARTAKAAQPEPAPAPQAEMEPDEVAEAAVPEEQAAGQPAAEVEAAEAGQAEPAVEEELEALTVPRLRELASERGITVPSRARKADIIEALRS